MNQDSAAILIERKEQLVNEIAGLRMMVVMEHQIYRAYQDDRQKHIYKETQAKAYGRIAECRRQIKNIERELKR